MKKSVIIAIAVIYIFAIVVVGFLGIRMRVYHEEKYVEKIICISDGYYDYDPNDPDDKGFIDDGFVGYIWKDYVEGLKVEIKCQVIPDDATNRTLEYLYDTKQQNYTVTVNSDGTATVSFKSRGTAEITIKAADNKGANTMIKIQIIALY